MIFSVANDVCSVNRLSLHGRHVIAVRVFTAARRVIHLIIHSGCLLLDARGQLLLGGLHSLQLLLLLNLRIHEVQHSTLVAMHQRKTLVEVVIGVY